MNPIQHFVDAIRQGSVESIDDLERELVGADASELLPLADAIEPAIRGVFVRAAWAREEPGVRDVLRRLARDPHVEVRLALAKQLTKSPPPRDDLIRVLLDDESNDVRYLALTAARGRPEFVDLLVDRLRSEPTTWNRAAAAESLARAEARRALPALMTALVHDPEEYVQRASARASEAILAASGGYPDDAPRPTHRHLQLASERLADDDASVQFPTLVAWLRQRLAVDVDVDLLREFGVLLSDDGELARLPRAHDVEATCEAVLACLRGAAPRAVVLVGETGSGKSVLVGELVHRLRADPRPWHVLLVAPSQFLVDTQYLGEWQTRVNRLVQAIRQPRRVLLVVPNLHELARVGQSIHGDDSVATALAPHVERGDVAILGESTPESFRLGLGNVPTLRRLFQVVQVQPAQPARTRAILAQVASEVGAELGEALADRVIELAEAYAVGACEPGRSVGLLRGALDRVAGRPLRERDLLETLSLSTGIPVDFLDDAVPLRRDEVRGFFLQRVMGQDEAVEAVLERVALVKAGLTDPGKPFGVLLFVGPTGVGKTELARALAEYLFGDSSRLIRLDMSEFATAETCERLVGWGHQPGLLAGPVREQPFSVLLLDEIDKAHWQVWDLCLQLFDAGRLTDHQGRTTDFRRTLIVLTSNVGSAVSAEPGLGFVGGGQAAPSADEIHRELSRWFRPEFLNRLDRIVTFKPLDAGTLEQIARREVDRVLERSGIARRRLDVDVDVGVLSLLLREGYSSSFGARPLKRTVERRLLLPLAWAIAGGEIPTHSLVRLSAKGGRVHVDVIVPRADEPDARDDGCLTTPVGDRAAALRDRLAQLSDRARPLAERRAELLARQADPSLYANDRSAAARLHDEIYRLSGVLDALHDLGRSANDLADWADRRRRDARELAEIARRLDPLESRAAHLEFLVDRREPRDFADAFVVLTALQVQGEPLDGVGQLARMYRSLARRREFECDVLDDRPGGPREDDTLTLLVSGPGAYALLSNESGLHEVVRGRPRDEGRPQRDREIVHVEVLPAPWGDVDVSMESLHVESRPIDNGRGRLLLNPNLDIQLLHRPSMMSLRAWTRGSKTRAIERLLPLLSARLHASSNDSVAPTQVRRYTLGPTPKVLDFRNRRSTARLEQVLRGHLDAFLKPNGT